MHGRIGTAGVGRVAVRGVNVSMQRSGAAPFSNSVGYPRQHSALVAALKAQLDDSSIFLDGDTSAKVSH